MAGFSDALLVLVVLSVTTQAWTLSHWSRRPPAQRTRTPGAPLQGVRMPPRRNPPLFPSRGIAQRMSGRNKIFMNHLQMSLNRKGNVDKNPRGRSQVRKTALDLRRGRLPPRLSLKALARKPIDMPRIDFKQLKAFNSHRNPLKNIRLAPFMPGFGPKMQPAENTKGMDAKGTHRKREHSDISRSQSHIESNPFIFTYDIKDRKSERTREHSPRDRSYPSAEEFLSRNPSSHLKPCDLQDRYKCLNGGVCVYVNALDMKVCRCPPEYTGRRCELLDQQYLLSIYSTSLETS